MTRWLRILIDYCPIVFVLVAVHHALSGNVALTVLNVGFLLHSALGRIERAVASSCTCESEDDPDEPEREPLPGPRRVA